MEGRIGAHRGAAGVGAGVVECNGRRARASDVSSAHTCGGVRAIGQNATGKTCSASSSGRQHHTPARVGGGTQGDVTRIGVRASDVLRTNRQRAGGGVTRHDVIGNNTACSGVDQQCCTIAAGSVTEEDGIAVCSCIESIGTESVAVASNQGALKNVRRASVGISIGKNPSASTRFGEGCLKGRSRRAGI